MILLPFKPVFKEHWLGNKIRSATMQAGNSVIPAFFVASPCVKELKSLNCILLNPEQAGGNAF